MKVIKVKIHKKLASAPVEKEQKLDISMVNYVSSKSKAKPRQSEMNKTYYSGHLLRFLWNWTTWVHSG